MDMPPSFTCSCYHLLILVCKNGLNVRQGTNVDCMSISSWNPTVELMFRPSSWSYRSMMTFASVELLWAYRARPDSKTTLQLKYLPHFSRLFPCSAAAHSGTRPSSCRRLLATTILRNPEARLCHCWYYVDWLNPNANLVLSWEGRRDGQVSGQ